ncbi:MAG: Lrp/AsnC family transcriptional regulator [Crenarchaeota archaeon]|nr:Lrp/AsnC family transcriptional regulator [Thermoproteota archaeon]
MAARRARVREDTTIIDQSTSLNERDKLILKTLVLNSKTTTTDIANKLNISDVATRRRIKRLEEDGTILFYTTILNPKRLGFNVVAHMLIETEPSRIDEVARELAELPNVVDLGTLLGDASIYAVVWAADLEDLEKIVREHIGKISYIKKIHTYLLAKPYKINGVKLGNGRVPYDGRGEA